MSIMKGLYAQCPGLLRRRGAVITAIAALSLAVAMTAIALLAPAGTQAQSAADTPAQNANTMAITEMSVVVTGTWTSRGYVTLDWEAPAGASDSTVYRMYRDNGKRNDIYIGGPSRTTTGAEGTSFRHFFWNTPGSWLTYWVLAEHPEGAYDPPQGLKGNRGTLSGPYHAQVPPAGPSAPTNPTATVNDAGHVVVSWGRPTTNAETGGCITTFSAPVAAARPGRLIRFPITPAPPALPTRVCFPPGNTLTGSRLTPGAPPNPAPWRK